MIARLGVRRCGPLVEAGACAAALACIVAGCSGNSLLVGEERPPADPGTDDGEGPDSINPVAPPPVDVALVSDCPPSPEERQALLGCWPPRHLGSWRGFFIGIPRYATMDGARAEFPPGDLLLELGIDGSAHLTFGARGQGSVGRDVPPQLCAPREATPGCPTPGLVIAGFAYELAQLELFDPMPGPQSRIVGELPPELAESMAFIVRVGEPWDIWCSVQGPESGPGCTRGDCSAGSRLPGPGTAIDSPAAAAPDRRGCRCDASGCRSEVASPSLSITLQMSDDKKALRGSYRSSDASIGEVGLEFRKSDP